MIEADETRREMNLPIVAFRALLVLLQRTVIHDADDAPSPLIQE